MFGYITIYKPELKIKDYYQYKAYYCGLCECLRTKYGLTGQMTLSYDMTFIVILLSSLYEKEPACHTRRCRVHPIKKIPMLWNEFTDYGAEINIILTYYHLIDDWKDDKSVSSLAGVRLLHKKAQTIIEKYPRQCRVIKNCLKRLSRYEKENSVKIDEVAGCFGELMGELFVYQKDQWEDKLRKFGFFLGKFIYLMDAYEDLEEDIKNHNYNPFKELYGSTSRERYEKICHQMLTMMMADCSREFERLPCLMESDIIRNVLYAGVWAKYDKIQDDWKEGKEQKHGK